jgi:hypothetical protein
VFPAYCLVPGNSISHSFGCVLDLGPLSIVLLLRLVVAWSYVKVHTQLALQSFPMLRRSVVPSAGNRSVWVAVVGSYGRFKFAV